MLCNAMRTIAIVLLKYIFGSAGSARGRQAYIVCVVYWAKAYKHNMRNRNHIETLLIVESGEWERDTRSSVVMMCNAVGQSDARVLCYALLNQARDLSWRVDRRDSIESEMFGVGWMCGYELDNKHTHTYTHDDKRRNGNCVCSSTGALSWVKRVKDCAKSE